MMGRNFIILNGSPRKRGNTAGLIDAFTEGAESAGHTVTSFFLDGMEIHGCKGCYQGGKDPESPCVQKDDMDKIYPVYRKADVVVLASPLYCWHFSGQLRTAFDRMLALSEDKSSQANKGKDAVLLMAGGGYDFEDSVSYYESLLRHLGWGNLGQVLAGGAYKLGDIKGHPALEEARKLGASL